MAFSQLEKALHIQRLLSLAKTLLSNTLKTTCSNEFGFQKIYDFTVLFRHF